MSDTASEAPASDERPLIQHPVWCKSETEKIAGQLTVADWSFTAPAEQDKIHRGRVYHVESGDVTIAFGLIQAYETAPEIDDTVHVSPAAIDLTMTDHASYRADAGTWLDVAPAKAMRELLDRAIDDLERLPRLPTTG